MTQSDFKSPALDTRTTTDFIIKIKVRRKRPCDKTDMKKHNRWLVK